MKLKSLFALPLLALACQASLVAAEPAAPKPAGAYPLDTCLVSDESLDAMGEPFVYTYKEEGKPDREIRFCCKSCLKKFTKNPAKYLAKLDAAAKAAPEKTSAPAAPAPATDAHAGHSH